MKIFCMSTLLFALLLFSSSLPQACAAAVLDNPRVIGDGDEVPMTAALHATVVLHCFTCSTFNDSGCGDPFNVTGASILPYNDESVCYKWKRGDDVIRGGMLDAEYLKLYEEHKLDNYTLRGRCLHMLCNGAPPAFVGLGLFLPLLFLLPLLGAGV